MVVPKILVSTVSVVPAVVLPIVLVVSSGLVVPTVLVESTVLVVLAVVMPSVVVVAVVIDVLVVSVAVTGVVALGAVFTDVIVSGTDAIIPVVAYTFITIIYQASFLFTSKLQLRYVDFVMQMSSSNY